MAPKIADPPSPDAVLIAACAAARAAVDACDDEAVNGAHGEAFAPLFERERLALECVAATRARTPRGIAEKSLLWEHCGETVEAVGLALSLAEDAVALVKDMVGGVPRRA
jgi:hypothetical protein